MMFQRDVSIHATWCMKFFSQKENTKERFLENEWNQWRVPARVTTMNVSSQHIISLEEDWKSFEDPQLSKFLFGFHLMKRHWLVPTPTSDLSRSRRVATNVHFQLRHSLLASNLNLESFHSVICSVLVNYDLFILLLFDTFIHLKI